MDEHFKLAYLFDIYAPLLTTRQRQALDLYYNADLSVSEIAMELQISRQAASDLLRRTERVLCGYDEKLCLFDKYMQNSNLLARICEQLQNEGAFSSEISALLSALRENL